MYLDAQVTHGLLRLERNLITSLSSLRHMIRVFHLQLNRGQWMRIKKVVSIISVPFNQFIRTNHIFCQSSNPAAICNYTKKDEVLVSVDRSVSI